jgi:hypothetical protein
LPSPDRARAALVRAIPFAIFAAALALLLHVSRRTGPSFEELGLLTSIERAGDTVRRIAQGGFGALSAPATRVEVGHPALLVLTAAWSELSLGRLGVLDPLNAARLPWLLLGATTPAALYVALRPSRGVAIALSAAFALSVMPRWLHAVVMQRDGAVVAAIWWFVLAMYLRSLGNPLPGTERGAPPRRWLFALLAALGFGLGLSLSLGSAWLLAPLLVHYLLTRAKLSWRMIRRGRWPLPASVGVALALAPGLVFATTPALWGSSPADVARFLFAPLAPSVTPTEYAGLAVSSAPVPAGFAASFLLDTLPLTLALAALAGALFLLHQALARRFASGRLRPRRDRHAVGLLALLVLTGTVFGPALAPQVLTTFPPRVELALPAFALLAALGAHALVTRLASVRARAVAAAVLAVGLALAGWTLPGMASLAFSPALGGARRIALGHAFALGDGSELALLAPALERGASGPVRLSAPREVPANYFAVLAKSRRLSAEVVIAPGGLTLARGPARGPAVGEVRRDGVVVWSLAR